MKVEEEMRMRMREDDESWKKLGLDGSL